MSGRDKSKLKTGVNDLPYVELRHPSGAQLDIYLHGAHATSWRDASGRQNLFVSEKSVFQPGFPVRGGIPTVFPQFGDGPLPKHGFTRINEWKLLNVLSVKNDYIEARFGLSENRQTLKIWPYEFYLELAFRLKAMELEISFSVTNSGEKEFEFKNGLHTYFAVADISRVAVKGLAGAKFFDFVGAGIGEREKRDRIMIDRETDRVYPSAPDTVVLEDEGSTGKITIQKQRMNDIVIWNPWVDKSKRMDDFGDMEYKTMLCIETGNLNRTIRLAPGAVHKSITTFIISKLTV